MAKDTLLTKGVEGTLTPAEKEVVNYHRNNLKTGNVGRDAEGRPITVYSVGIRVPSGPNKGKFVSVPGFVNGMVIEDEEQLWNIWKNDIDRGRWPTYKTGQELNRRSREIHTIMDKDVEK